MGCGASNDPKIGVADSLKPLPNNKNNYNNDRSNKNDFKQHQLKYPPQNSNKSNDRPQEPISKNSKMEINPEILIFKILFFIIQRLHWRL